MAGNVLLFICIVHYPMMNIENVPGTVRVHKEYGTRQQGH